MSNKEDLKEYKGFLNKSIVAVFLDDGTYSVLSPDVKVLVAEKSGAVQEWLDNDPKLSTLDRYCPDAYWETFPVQLLLEDHMMAPVDIEAAITGLAPDPVGLSDEEVLAPYTGYPPPEWDLPGSSDYDLTFQHGGENADTCDELDELVIENFIAGKAEDADE